MKRELISAAVGAGLVGAVWAGSTYAEHGKETHPEPQVSARYPGKMRRTIANAHSARAQGRFPGLALRSNDFLIPLNRLLVTQHVYFDDPDEFYGSGGHPMYALLFGISEGDKVHYFLTSGREEHEIGDLVYLGEDIEVDKIGPEGNGWWMATYKDRHGLTGKGVVALQTILGEEPVRDFGIAQPILLDPLAEYADECDPFVWTINAEEFWKRYQQAVRENDKMTLAKMHTFPIGGRFGTIYTRAEFVEQYDRICNREWRDWILNGCSSEKIWYSWRGAHLPDGEWLRNACGPNDPAGPLEE